MDLEQSHAWLAPDEWDAIERAAAQLAGKESDPAGFLSWVLDSAMDDLHRTQPEDDRSYFSVDDLTEEDRKALLLRGGFDVDSPELLELVTAMPEHTVVSDGTAKWIAGQVLAGRRGDPGLSALALFQQTGAVVPELRGELSGLSASADEALGRQLLRISRYLSSSLPEGGRGVQPGWDALAVPGWVDRPSAAEPLGFELGL